MAMRSSLNQQSTVRIIDQSKNRDQANSLDQANNPDQANLRFNQHLKTQSKHINLQKSQKQSQKSIEGDQLKPPSERKQNQYIIEQGYKRNPIIQNSLFLWIDKNYEQTRSNYEFLIDNLPCLACNELLTAQQIIQEYDTIVESFYIITSNSMIQSVSEKIAKHPKVDQIYLFCGNLDIAQQHQLKYKKIRAVSNYIQKCVADTSLVTRQYLRKIRTPRIISFNRISQQVQNLHEILNINIFEQQQQYYKLRSYITKIFRHVSGEIFILNKQLSEKQNINELILSRSIIYRILQILMKTHQNINQLYPIRYAIYSFYWYIRQMNKQQRKQQKQKMQKIQIKKKSQKQNQKVIPIKSTFLNYGQLHFLQCHRDEYIQILGFLFTQLSDKITKRQIHEKYINAKIIIDIPEQQFDYETQAGYVRYLHKDTRKTEIIFNLFSIFKVVSIDRKDKITYIKLQYTELKNIKKQKRNYIQVHQSRSEIYERRGCDHHEQIKKFKEEQ